MSTDEGLSVRRSGEPFVSSTIHVGDLCGWLVMWTTAVLTLRLGRSAPRSCMPGSKGRGRRPAMSLARRRHHQNPTPANARGITKPKTTPRAIAFWRDLALTKAAAAAA